MPYLSLRTNIELARDARDTFLQDASRLVSEGLGKSERYVMVDVQANQGMCFASSDAPLAYLELKSIELPEDKVPALSTSLCDLVESRLGIPKDRVYIEFADVPRSMWGWNGGTF